MILADRRNDLIIPRSDSGICARKRSVLLLQKPFLSCRIVGRVKADICPGFRCGACVVDGETAGLADELVNFLSAFLRLDHSENLGRCPVRFVLLDIGAALFGTAGNVPYKTGTHVFNRIIVAVAERRYLELLVARACILAELDIGAV